MMPEGIERIVVTTCERPPGEVMALAKGVSGRYGLPFVERKTATLARLRREQEANLLVASGEGLHYVTGRAIFRYHPGMARVRLHNLAKGRGDPMVQAMGLQRGFSVLDCTLGLGSDAVVAGFAVGPEGRVVGVERCLPVYLVVSHGLAAYEEKTAVLRDAMRRIQAHWGDCAEYLSRVGEGEFDVIYFDPFFEEPVHASSGIAPLRAVAKGAGGSLDAALEEGRRKARLRVVVKGRPGSPFFSRHPFQRFFSGTRSRIQYGVIDRINPVPALAPSSSLGSV